MKKYKLFFAFCVVLALSCSSAFAFAPLAIFAKPSAEPEAAMPAEESAETLTESIETLTVSTETMTDSETSSISYEDLEAMIDGKKWMTPKEVAEFKTALSDVTASIGADIDSLKSDFAKVQADLAKELKAKFFLDAGLAFGYKEGIDFGFCGDIGMRKNSVIFKAGVQYMVGNTEAVLDILHHDWSLSNLTVQTTIGYEW